MKSHKQQQTKKQLVELRPPKSSFSVIAVLSSYAFSLLLLLTIILNISLPAESHGTMIDPVSRNSLWRVDKTAPVNYNDIELFCGGIGVLSANGNKCGVCGDPYPMRRPRPHETGGQMVTNRTVRNYFPGSSIDLMIDLDTNHGGYFEFELCRRQSFDELEQDECFEKLKFMDGNYRRRLDFSERGLISMSLMMPEDLRECRACILRWNYRAGNNWGVCPDGTSATGCGAQELYRNCADISVGYQNYLSIGPAASAAAWKSNQAEGKLANLIGYKR